MAIVMAMVTHNNHSLECTYSQNFYRVLACSNHARGEAISSTTHPRTRMINT